MSQLYAEKKQLLFIFKTNIFIPVTVSAKKCFLGPNFYYNVRRTVKNSKIQTFIFKKIPMEISSGVQSYVL